MTHEQMLETAVEQAWRRLQEAYDLERRVFEQFGALDLFTNDLERFKTIARHMVDCERIWRRAVDELSKFRRASAQEVPAPQPEITPLVMAAASSASMPAPQPSAAAWDNEGTPPRFPIPGLCSTASPCTARASTT